MVRKEFAKQTFRTIRQKMKKHKGFNEFSLRKRMFQKEDRG